MTKRDLSLFCLDTIESLVAAARETRDVTGKVPGFMLLTIHHYHHRAQMIRAMKSCQFK